MFKVSKPEMVNKTFRMPAELVERLNVVAQAQKVSLNNSDYLQKARKYGHFTGYKN